MVIETTKISANTRTLNEEVISGLGTPVTRQKIKPRPDTGLANTSGKTWLTKIQEIGNNETELVGPHGPLWEEWLFRRATHR
jgi:hypothetical protein